MGFDDETEIRLRRGRCRNRVERLFSIFKPCPQRGGHHRLDDAFLERRSPPSRAGHRASTTAGTCSSSTSSSTVSSGRRNSKKWPRSHAPASRRSLVGSFLQMANSALKATSLRQPGRFDDGGKAGSADPPRARLPPPPRGRVRPNAGRVVFAGWMSLYGNTVIIDHGDGLLSLCEPSVIYRGGRGDAVGKGQIIARSGSTGSPRRPPRPRDLCPGELVDPLEWLDAKWIEEKIMSKLTTELRFQAWERWGAPRSGRLPSLTRIRAWRFRPSTVCCQATIFVGRKCAQAHAAHYACFAVWLESFERTENLLTM